MIWKVLNETGSFFFPWNPACFLIMYSDKYVIVSTGSQYVATKITSQGENEKGVHLKGQKGAECKTGTFTDRPAPEQAVLANGSTEGMVTGQYIMHMI